MLDRWSPGNAAGILGISDGGGALYLVSASIGGECELLDDLLELLLDLSDMLEELEELELLLDDDDELESIGTGDFAPNKNSLETTSGWSSIPV